MSAARVDSMPTRLRLKHADHWLGRAADHSTALHRSQDSTTPTINVEVSAPKPPKTNEKIARMLLGKTTRILCKRADLTAITVGYGRPELWIVGGKSPKAKAVRQ